MRKIPSIAAFARELPAWQQGPEYAMLSLGDARLFASVYGIKRLRDVETHKAGGRPIRVIRPMNPETGELEYPSDW
jgi:hypothetical protein